MEANINKLYGEGLLTFFELCKLCIGMEGGRYGWPK